MSLQVPRTVAIIGSFRRFYSVILDAYSNFHRSGYMITSPLGAEITEESRDSLFIRFASDPVLWSDEKVESVALHRIMRADFVYVVCPSGYVGKTTSYEVGRIVHAAIPLYFGEHPSDLPISVPASHIASIPELVDRFAQEAPNAFLPEDEELAALEISLRAGKYLDL